MIFLICLILAFGPTLAFAQKEKEKESKTEEDISKYEMANAEYLMIEAQKFFLLEDYQRALAFLEKSIEVDPKNHAAYFKSAEINYTLGEYKKGIIAIKQAQSIEPTNKFYYLLAAQLYKVDNDLLSAANEYETMIKNSENYRDYLLDLADVYVALENYTRAIAILNLTEEKFNTPNKFATQKKELYLQSGDDKKALELMKAMVEQYPENEDYQLEYADLLTSIGKTKEAEAVLKSNGKSELSTIKRLNLKVESGEINENKTEIRNAFSLQDLTLESKLSLVSNLIKTPDLDQQSLFIDSLQSQLIAQYPNNLEVLKSSELVYAALAASADLENKEDFKKTELIILNQLKNLNPADYEVWDKLLKKSFDQGSWETLLKDSEDALSYFPNQAIFYYYYGNAQIKAKNGDKDEAISALNQAERLSRTDTELQSKIVSLKESINNIDNPKKNVTNTYVVSQAGSKKELNDVLARFVTNQNDRAASSQALVIVDDLITKFPNDVELYITKARILFQINSFAEARSALRRARDIEFQKGREITDGSIVELYGDILFNLNEVDEAVSEWKKAKELGNTSDKIDKKIADKKYYK